MWNRKVQHFLVWKKNFASSASATATAMASSSTNPISVPMRIKRKPTDILKALASTVQDDPTGHAYMFVDDPIMAPTRSFEAQNFAMSKELGRRMAKYFASQYPTLFMYDEDEPRLSAFRPTQKPRTEDASDEASLNDRIDRLWVQSAVGVYTNAMARQESISTPTLLKLLELLAFYNHNEPNDLPEAPVEVFYRQYMPPPPKTPWIDECLAMKIYDQLPEPKDPRATAAIICGMLKYFAVEKGYELWKLSRELGGDEDGKLKDPRVYECLIKYGVERLKAVNEERWQLVMEILRAMAADGVKPTIHVFNAAFEVLSKASRWKRTEESAKQLMQEMLHLGIHPSLGTFYYVLRIHAKRASLANVLNAIVAHLEHHPDKRSFSDEIDGKFFPEAMILACENLHDRPMVFRLHKLLKTGDNYLYMTDHGDELKYYRAFVTFMSVTEDTKTYFEKYYQPFTPRHFVPDSRLMEAVLRNIEMSNDYKYLSNVCSDMIIYGHMYRRELVWEFLQVALRAPMDQLTADVSEKMVQVAQDIFKKIDSQYEWMEQMKVIDRKKKSADLSPTTDAAEDGDGDTGGVDGKKRGGGGGRERSFRLEWTSDLLASLAVLSARGGAARQAWKIFVKAVPLTEEELKMKKRQGIAVDPVIGEVPESMAVELLDAFVRQKWFDESYATLRVLARGKNPKLIKEAAEKIRSNIPANEAQLAKLEKYRDSWSEEKTPKS